MPERAYRPRCESGVLSGGKPLDTGAATRLSARDYRAGNEARTRDIQLGKVASRSINAAYLAASAWLRVPYVPGYYPVCRSKWRFKWRAHVGRFATPPEET